VVVTFVGWDWGWVGGGGGGTRIFGEQGGDDGVDSVGVDGGVRGEVGMGGEVGMRGQGGVDSRRIRRRICSRWTPEWLVTDRCACNTRWPHGLC